MIEKEVWRTSEDGMAQDGRRGVCGRSRAHQSAEGAVPDHLFVDPPPRVTVIISYTLSSLKN